MMMYTRRKLGGFLIPQRTMTQTFVSAFQGMLSLLGEQSRVRFIDSLEKGIIQESVLSQATAGPMMMLSLFHELQNPLFHKNQFDPDQFLEGVAPALENFHNVSAALENELHDIKAGEEIDKSSEETTTLEEGAVTKEERESLLSALSFVSENEEEMERKKKTAEAVLDHEWMVEARANPDSLAAQLSRMVTAELFQINQLSSKTAFLLQNQTRNILFQEGSCKVNNVALLSAKACLFREAEPSETEESNNEMSFPKRYEPIEYNYDDEYDESNTAVAAQLEVLYDVTQEFAIGSTEAKVDEKETRSPPNKSEDESTQTTIVSVATLEGWLHGGPDDGQLRWKLASYRPPYEFPDIEHAYKY